MQYFILGLGLLSFNAHAYLYTEQSRTYLSDVECLESLPSEIECKRVRDDLLLCQSEFEALMKHGGVKTLNIKMYEEIPLDNKLFRPLTDKINELWVGVKVKSHVKERIKRIEDLGICQ